MASLVSYESASDDEVTSAAPAVEAPSAGTTIVAAPDVYVEVWSPVFGLLVRRLAIWYLTDLYRIHLACS
jgi:hypothetical protein